MSRPTEGFFSFNGNPRWNHEEREQESAHLHTCSDEASVRHADGGVQQAPGYTGLVFRRDHHDEVIYLNIHSTETAVTVMRINSQCGKVYIPERENNKRKNAKVQEHLNAMQRKRIKTRKNYQR